MHIQDGAGPGNRPTNALFIQAWKNFLGQSGGGFAYFPVSPGPNATVTTASGDSGDPDVYLGDGWWWVN